LKMGKESRSVLFINHATQDWRDVLPTITVPTLVVGGEASFFDHKGVEWLATQIPGAKSKIYGKGDGGSHFVFWENAEGFNKTVDDFLG